MRKWTKNQDFGPKNIICIPLVNWEGKCIGALQSLNKTAGDFDDDDKDLLFAISNYVTIALENMKLYESLKAVNKARDRAIHHLSHELKTPLALISSVFERFRKEERDTGDSKFLKRVDRGQRNVHRLMELQEKIDDILNHRAYEEKERISNIISAAADFAEEMEEKGATHVAQTISLLLKRIESVYGTEAIAMEHIELQAFLNSLFTETTSAMAKRTLEIIRHLEQGLWIRLDQGVLTKIFGGLYKNAIENTPDEGRIEIHARSKEDKICVAFTDYGIGITPENQKLIFGGFFHTQDTMIYTSKKPYDFLAGGSGSDLLRIKVLAERHGFTVEFESSRCSFIPTDTDQCPGSISKCPFVSAPAECHASGGSCFPSPFQKHAIPPGLSMLRHNFSCFFMKADGTWDPHSPWSWEPPRKASSFCSLTFSDRASPLILQYCPSIPCTVGTSQGPCRR